MQKAFDNASRYERNQQEMVLTGWHGTPSFIHGGSSNGGPLALDRRGTQFIAVAAAIVTVVGPRL
jgi:hypothetical protein